MLLEGDYRGAAPGGKWKKPSWRDKQPTQGDIDKGYAVREELLRKRNSGQQVDYRNAAPGGKRKKPSWRDKQPTQGDIDNAYTVREELLRKRNSGQ